MKAIVKVKSYMRQGIRVKSHKRTPPDNICSNNLRPKRCKSSC